MQSFQETLAAWAAILGTILTFVGLIQSRAWLTALSTVFVLVAILAGAYAKGKQKVIDSASIKIDGLSIDSLNLANLRRRVNRSLTIQDVRHVARISGCDLNMTWRYAGFCRAQRETAIEFSVDADNNIPFDRLDCYAYDLKRDPHMSHRIKPVLIGPDGHTKKLAIPLLAPLTAQESFDVMLNCDLPGCLGYELGYYTSTLSFDQEHVRHFSTRLIFFDESPKWLRVYQCDAFGKASLLKEAAPDRPKPGRSEYLDVADNSGGQSARVYVFCRAGATATTK